MESTLFDETILKGLKLSDWTATSFKPELSLEKPGDGLVVRSLRKDDFLKGFPEILAQMTVLGDVSEEKFIAQFDKMKRCPDTYYVTVIEDLNTSQIVGCATLLIEHKFIHDCSKRARIEDVVVRDSYRGKQLGKLLVSALALLAKELKCYKLSLDCRDEMAKFYASLGFIRQEGNSNFMVIRF